MIELSDGEPSEKVPDELIAELRHIRDQIRRLSWLEPGTVPREDLLAWVRRDERLDHLREEEAHILERMAEFDPGFVGLLLGKTIGWPDIQELVSDIHEILIEFLVNENSTLVFVVTADKSNEPDMLLLEDCGLPDLAMLALFGSENESLEARGFLTLYWQERYDEWSQELQAALRHLYSLVFEKESADGRSLQSLLAHFRSQLIERSDQVRLTIIPHGPLHFFPIHACPSQASSSNRRLIDEYTIAYAPSTTMLRQTRQRTRHYSQLCAYSDPDGSLPGSSVEVESIQRYFAGSRKFIFPPRNAIKLDIVDKMQNASVIHAAGHANHVLHDFAQSRLRLSDDDLLLREVLADVCLRDTVLVVLSACETGIPPTDEMVNEVLSFATAFLHAGAKWVVATQWRVADIASCLLMLKMYELLFCSADDAPELTPPDALARAQRWFKNLSPPKAQDYLQSQHVSGELLSGFEDFEDPIYWAAFYCSGA